MADAEETAQEEWTEEEATLTFLPAKLTQTESPLSQYLPFRTMAPEEQACAKYMFNQLPERQADWLVAYLQSWDVEKACKLTGVRKASFDFDVLRPLLSILKKAERAFMLKKSGITRQRYLEELQAIAFLDPADLVDENDNPLPIKQVPRHARVALQYASKDTPKGPEIRISPYEKQAALKMFGEVMGYLEKDNPIPTSKPIEIIFVKSEPKADDEPKEIVTNVDHSRHPEGALPEEVIYPF